MKFIKRDRNWLRDAAQYRTRDETEALKDIQAVWAPGEHDERRKAAIVLLGCTKDPEAARDVLRAIGVLT